MAQSSIDPVVVAGDGIGTEVVDDGVMAGRVEDIDAAVTEAARALAEG